MVSMRDSIKTSKIWDKRWASENVSLFIKNSFFTDAWTLHHKKLIDKYLTKLNPNSIFLEAGCGLGQWCFYVSQKYKIRSVGVDIANETIEKLNEYCKTHKNKLVSFLIADLNTNSLPSNHYDMFVSLGVIEHFEDSKPMMDNLHRILKQGGFGIVTTPNLYSLHTITRPIAKIIGRWDIGYEKSFSPDSLRLLAIDSGFRVVEYGVLLSGELFGTFLNKLPLIGNFFLNLSYFLEKRQKTFGFISYIVVEN